MAHLLPPDSRRQARMSGISESTSPTHIVFSDSEGRPFSPRHGKMVLPPPPNPLASPNGRHDLSDEDDDEAAIQAQEMRGAVQGLAAWQTGRHKELDRELADLEAAFAGKVRELRSKLADDFLASKSLKRERLQALEAEQAAQQTPVEKWALGPLLAKHEDEITTIHVELASELRNMQDAHERLVEQLKHVRARDERRLHKRKEAVTNVISRMQTMQAENLQLVERNNYLNERIDKAEYAAVAWQKEADSLQQKLRDLAERDARAAADRAAREVAERERAHEAGMRLAAEERAAEREAQLREAQERERAREEETRLGAQSFKSPRRRLWGPCCSQPPVEQPRTTELVRTRRALFEAPRSDAEQRQTPVRGKENNGGSQSAKPVLSRMQSAMAQVSISGSAKKSAATQSSVAPPVRTSDRSSGAHAQRME